MMTTKEQVNLSLPSLTSLVPRFKSVPRRYEETRPVIIQDFSHRKIVKIGHEIERKVLELAEQEKHAAVAEAERRVWSEAAQVQRDALEKTKQRCRNEQEKAVKKLLKTHEKHVKEEILRVEGELQKIAFDQVQAEREAGERRLIDAVERTEQRCLREKLQAVQQAREEELRIAADKADRVAQKHAAELAETISEAARNKAEALAELTAKMTQEKQEAVDLAHSQEQDIAATALAKQKETHEECVAELEMEIENGRSGNQQLREVIEELEQLKANCESEYMAVRKEFQNYINKCKYNYKGQAEYMIPSCKEFIRSKTTMY